MLIGRFYFKITATGNLVGEYSHRKQSLPGSFAEAATRVTPGTGWGGDYLTTWCEGLGPNLVTKSAQLKITQATSGAFTVHWSDLKGNLLFDGEAMIADGMLVGDYQQV